MRISAFIWFVAGFAFCLVYLDDGIGGVLRGIVTVVGGIVTFVLTLGGVASGGVLGAVAVLAVIGVALLVGRSWAERARAFYDADLLFKRRRNYRLPPDKRV
ncbi:MAG: hypothetical protein KY460_15510 [Actinobacteria bacterium]|nr:hypothetical protein [Actinomycetota bacterium]